MLALQNTKVPAYLGTYLPNNEFYFHFMDNVLGT